MRGQDTGESPLLPFNVFFGLSSLIWTERVKQHLTRSDWKCFPNLHLSRSLLMLWMMIWVRLFQHQKTGSNQIWQEFNKHYSLISLFFFTDSSAWDQNTQLRKTHKNLLPNDSSSLSNENIFKGNIWKVKHIYQKILTIPPNLYTNNTESIANIISRKEEMHLAVIDQKLCSCFW